MPAVLAAASYYRGGFSLCLAGSAKHDMVPGGSTFHLEPVTITGDEKYLSSFCDDFILCAGEDYWYFCV